MKKFFLIIFLMSIVCAMAHADVLNVWKTTGDKVTYDFSKQPEIKFVYGMIVVYTVNGADEYDPAELNGFTFNEKSFVSAGVHSAVVSGIDLRISEDEYTVSGLKEGTSVIVTDASGKITVTAKAGNNGSVTIPSSKLVSGINIIKAGTSTFKTIRQ